MRVGALLAIAALTVAAQAHAGAPTSNPQADKAKAQEGSRVVLICDRSAESRRAFEREHGAPMIFMSAEQLAKAESTKEAWSSPRCITEAELQRYEFLADEAKVLRARGD